MSPAVFCSTGRNRVCKGNEHTLACRRREMLGRQVVRWLHDEEESERRARLANEIGGELDAADMLTLFLRWRSERNIGILGTTEAISNLSVHRSVPDGGEFAAVLETAMQIVQEEAFSKAHPDQTNLKVKDRARAKPDKLFIGEAGAKDEGKG